MSDSAPSTPTSTIDNPFTSAAIALQRRPPWLIARMVSLTLCAMAMLALIYAWLAPMDVVISSQGRVIPSGKSKVVQPIEAGIVRAIHVRDGATVKAGDVLIEMDHTATGADSDRLQREMWEAEAEAERLAAMSRGAHQFAMAGQVPQEIIANQAAILKSRTAEHRFRSASLEADLAKRQADRDAIAANLTQLRASLPLITKRHAMRQELAKTGHIAETGVIETQLEQINLEKEISIQQNRLKEAEAGLRVAAQQKAQADAEYGARLAAESVDATRRRESARQELVKANQRQSLQVLRAPIDGVVQQLAVSTVGGVVTQAQPLMMIVPANATLEVEAQVLNRDIGHIRAGQSVIIKVETFDFTRYGHIDGVVQWVATDAMADPKIGPIYPVRIQLRTDQTPFSINGRHGLVSPGMNVTADIRVDQRRLLEYFLSPLLRYKEEGLRER